MDKLTKKQQGFVEDYLETGNATEAAERNYDVKDRSVANAIGAENLSKPSIRNVIMSIADSLTEEELTIKHKQLLNANNMERHSFDEATPDNVIEEVIKKMEGHELLHIVENKNTEGKVYSKYAYVKVPDNQTQDKALDKAYKIKGTYAPEKSINLDLQIDVTDPKARELAQKYEEEIKKGL